MLAACGVWQNTQTSVSVEATTLRLGATPVVRPTSVAEKLCLVARISETFSAHVVDAARASARATSGRADLILLIVSQILENRDAAIEGVGDKDPAEIVNGYARRQVELPDFVADPADGHEKLTIIVKYQQIIV